MSWVAPMSLANRLTTDRATSSEMGNSPPRILISAGRPAVTSSLKPAGMTIAAPAVPARISSAAAASVVPGAMSATPDAATAGSTLFTSTLET